MYSGSVERSALLGKFRNTKQEVTEKISSLEIKIKDNIYIYNYK